MTAAVRELLQTFEALTDAEKQVVTIQLLRRAVAAETGNISDDGLIAVAEELFLELEAREGMDDQP